MRKIPSDIWEKMCLVDTFYVDKVMTYASITTSHVIRNFHLAVESSRGTAKNPGLKLGADFGYKAKQLDGLGPLTCEI